ncbi:MAG: PepSY-associated TM helix domain-containing protein, partial [Acidimicrobiia bacterium]
ILDLTTQSYQLTVEQQGWVGVLNDLHKGRDTVSSWNWLVDVSGIFLVVISVTGLALQLLIRKRRRSALVVAGIGTVITLFLTVIAVS